MRAKNQQDARLFEMRTSLVKPFAPRRLLLQCTVTQKLLAADRRYNAYLTLADETFTDMARTTSGDTNDSRRVWCDPQARFTQEQESTFTGSPARELIFTNNRKEPDYPNDPGPLWAQPVEKQTAL